MSIHLLDINVLVALLWTNHEHHAVAREWFKSSHRAGWATCPLTQAGFVRISSNPRIFPDTPPPAKALEILRANLEHKKHHFWKDDITLFQAVAPFEDRYTGHQQTTDAYLLGLAIHRGGVLLTFDKNIATLLPENTEHLRSLRVLEG